MHEVKAKGILSSSNGMNTYRGCTHGCIYCDSRSRCYHIDHKFEDIEVKINALELLEDALRRKRKKCIIGTGSMCDPYMPLEKHYKITRGCLEIVDKYGFGFTFITKSSSCLRDLDLFKRINEKTKCVVQMTLTTYDDRLCKIIEPNVATTSERFETLKVLRDNGIPTVVWFCPFLPYINDTEENLRGLLSMCIEAKVKGIINFGIGFTMRDGSREYLYKNLDKHFPGLSDTYRNEFGGSYSCSSKNHNKLMKLFYDTCEKNNIMFNNKEIFDYIHRFEEKEKEEQLSLF